tara:strand:- start:320 stop:526 length:207 start_codon:yes stop_codon:yes gene_type:complete
MNRVYELREIVISTNPDYLREIADKMEKKWPTLSIGQDTFVANIGCMEDGTSINVNMDQEWFNNKIED